MKHAIPFVIVARNTGSVKTTLIGTYVVESGKPLSAPAQ